MFVKQNLSSNVLLNYTTDAITMSAGDMSISTSATNGSFIQGPLSVTGPFTNIRFNSGLFKFNSLLLSTMPSTIITPIPVFEMDLPVKQLALMASVATMIFSTAAGAA
jgi:hypothetical protein